MRFPFAMNWTAVLSVCALLCTAGAGQSRAADLEQLLKDGRVPGLSFTLLRDGRIVETKGLGVRDVSTGVAVDENTIFEAASLSKPVFAYAVLQLIDAGVLSLDTPLSKYVPDYVKADPRAATITVRNVLSQTSGLPNWGATRQTRSRRIFHRANDSAIRGKVSFGCSGSSKRRRANPWTAS